MSNRDKSLGTRLSSDGARNSLISHKISEKKKCFHTILTERIKYKSISGFDHGINFHPEFLSLLTQHAWEIHRVSPLNGLDINRVQLKNYAAKIKQELIRECEGSTSSVQFDTKITLVPASQGDPSDVFSIKIEVFTIKIENKPVCKYRGVIISWEGDNLFSAELSKMPLMLCMGTVHTIRIVHRVISALFDTLIHPLRISEDDLMWLTAIQSDCFSQTSKNVSFDYSIHDSETKHQIILTLPCAIINQLWKKIHDSDSDVIKIEEVDLFNKQITSQLEKVFCIKLELLNLYQIELPGAVISSAGKMKIFTEDAMIRILTFLNDLAVIMETPTLAMSDITVSI